MARTVYDTDDLAGYRTAEGQRPLQLWAGDAKIITEGFAKANAGDTFSKYEVVAINADGKVIKYDGSGAGDAGTPRGFLAQPIAADVQNVQVFTGGYPNHEALKWPAAMDTFDKRRHAFLGNGSMFIGKLNGVQPA